MNIAKYLAHKTIIKQFSDYLAKSVQVNDSNIDFKPSENQILLSVRNLTISTPDKRLLVSNLSFAVKDSRSRKSRDFYYTLVYALLY